MSKKQDDSKSEKLVRVLHINTADIIGGAGIAAYRLHKSLNERERFTSSLLVGIKAGNDNKVKNIMRNKFEYYINRVMHKYVLRFEYDGIKAFSNRNVLLKHISDADIIHLHNIHGGFFSLPEIVKLAKVKPIVWTLHDTWATIGHFQCTDIFGGCKKQDKSECKRRTSKCLLEIKQQMFQNFNMKLIVHSLDMLRNVTVSPLTKKFETEYVPFGIDNSVYNAKDKKDSKGYFGIPDDSIVIGLRANLSKQKGLFFAIEALKKIQPGENIWLLTFDSKGLVDELKNRYSIVELGWVKDQNVMSKAFNAMDIFLMPSTSESFGLMAMEAMACGTVVLAFDGTALQETLYAPLGGITVPQGDIEALKEMIENLINNPLRRTVIGNKAIELADKNYKFEIHISKVIEIYEKLLEV